MVRAAVDNRRLLRLNAYKIVEGYRGSKDMPSVSDFYSLPFDDELIKLEREEIDRTQREAQEVFEEAVRAGYFNMKIEDLIKN